MKNTAGLIKNFVIFFIIFILIAAAFSYLANPGEEDKQMSLSQLVTEIREENVSSIKVEGDLMKVELGSGEKKTVKKESGESAAELLSNLGVSSDKIAGANINIEGESDFDAWILPLLSFVLPFLIIAVFIYFMMRGVQGANSKAMMFGQSQAKEFSKDGKKKVTFKDVAGSREPKEELAEVIEFLKHPKKFINLGAEIPKGFLLLGPPGTGKTLMARAVAGEADVPFFHISGSEFVEMFVGVGASRVRDMFSKAKKNAPCIVFIDEIDAVGRKRGAGLGGSHDEREQTLNQILVEMDGFDPHANVIVVAATNRPDVLDPALLRPGRFDRRIVVDIPDLKEREAILKVHAKGKPLAKEVDLKRIAERTPGFSGADLDNLLNEASILTARKNEKEVKMEYIYDSIEKVMMGPERRSRIITDNEKKVTAYHEAAHALVAHSLPHTDPVQKVSIIARGRAAGYTLKTPQEDKRMHSRVEFVEELSVLLAGHTVEKEVLKDITTGATSDLRKATELARSLVTDYGMSDKMAPRTYGQSQDMVFLGKEIHEQRDYSEKTAQEIDQEIEGLIRDAVKTAEDILQDKKEELEEVVKALYEKETIEKEEFEEILGKKKKEKEKKIGIDPNSEKEEEQK